MSSKIFTSTKTLQTEANDFILPINIFLVFYYLYLCKNIIPVRLNTFYRNIIYNFLT